MVTRRDIVTAGMLGTLSTATREQGAQREVVQSADSKILSEGLREIRQQLAQIETVLDESFRQNSRAQGVVIPLRRQFELFLKANNKFPEFCDVGLAVFVEIYDWHVKHKQLSRLRALPMAA